jgi:hypothetical protein
MAIIWVGTGRFSAYIGPVQDYIDRVVAADVAAGNTLGLEVGVRDAYDVFIRACLDTGELGSSGGVLSQANSIIKAAPIMAGARTLAGALVPLVGTAPTNFNFVAGDYNRKTGLVGNGSTKYLNSNRNNNADPQNSFHMSCHVTVIASATSVYMGGGVTTTETGISNMGRDGPGTFARNRANTAGTRLSALPVGFVATNRSSSTNYTRRANGAQDSRTETSQSPSSFDLMVFSATGGAFPTNARLAFYSIGESLDLALLDTRVTALIDAIAAAIP